jgi:hypothetical protein
MRKPSACLCLVALYLFGNLAAFGQQKPGKATRHPIAVNFSFFASINNHLTPLHRLHLFARPVFAPFLRPVLVAIGDSPRFEPLACSKLRSASLYG